MKPGRHISIMLQFQQKKSCDNSNIHKDNLDFYKNMLLFFTLYIKWINLGGSTLGQARKNKNTKNILNKLAWALEKLVKAPLS